MDSEKIINEPEMVKMSHEEFETQTAKAREYGYRLGKSEAEKEIDEIKAKLRDAEKDKILLQVRNDQLLKAVKEIALCLQYETGSGFIK